MAEPDDLLGKADALMARHRPARPGSESYAEIPLLNEVVELPHGADDLPLLTELAKPPQADADGIEVLAERMRAALLAALQPGIDSLIEERLKDGLSPLVEKMFHELRGDLQLIARDVLIEAIRTAVEQELQRRKSGG